MYDWLSTVNDKFWLILNYSKVVWDIDTKFSPVVVLMSFQLSTKFEGHNSLKKTAMPLGSSKWKWAWQAHFLSHTYETQKICCFLADVQIILVSLFEFFDYIKVAKNAGAFLSRCSELLAVCHWGSMAGSVIQATGRTDFEDGLRTGTKLEVRNGLQSIHTIPEVNMVSPLGPAMTPGA